MGIEKNKDGSPKVHKTPKAVTAKQCLKKGGAWVGGKCKMPKDKETKPKGKKKETFGTTLSIRF